MQTGQFIVIEGSDGSGKETQADLLIRRTLSEGFSVNKLDFPQYKETIFGRLIRETLDGKYGSLPDTRIFSVLYAADRSTVINRLHSARLNGELTISNRFTLSNIVHQSVRIDIEEERGKFRDWLIDMEHGTEGFSIPRPDLYIVLNVPAELCRERIEARLQQKYTQDDLSLDLLESDVEHQMKAVHMYKEVASNMKDIVLIDCVPSGVELTKEQVHELVWREAQKFIYCENIEGRINRERE